MAAKIIVLTNQKGGCGKTTITMNIAPAIAKKGFKVLVVDGDPQGTATRWASSAEDEHPYPVPVIGLANTEKKAHREIEKHVNNYDYILVDCPPAIESSFPASALLVADLAIIPIKPTPPDMWAAIGIKKLLKMVNDIREFESRILISMAQNNTLSEKVTQILSDFDIPKLTASVGQRVVYCQSSIGSSVYDFKDQKAIAEIESLTNEILSIV